MKHRTWPFRFPVSSPIARHFIPGIILFWIVGLLFGSSNAVANAADTSAPFLAPYQVKEIYPGSEQLVFGQGWRPYAGIEDTLFFVADDSFHGPELWKSDGTPEGTTMVKDINPANRHSGPQWLINFNGILFFSASDGVHGFELWKSDGTPKGTVMVKDIFAGASHSYPTGLYQVGDNFFFSADDGVHGIELWTSDGTSEGTVMVKDINPSDGRNKGSEYDQHSYPSWVTNINGTIFFRADDGIHGFQLWKTRGTPESTTMITDINSDTDSFQPTHLTNVNGTLFFSANDGIHGEALWKSDGTREGTVMVKDIYPGTDSSVQLEDLINVNDVLFFSADDGVHGFELWKSDGTPGGTVMVKDIGADTDHIRGPRNFANINGTLFFEANDGIHGWELWKSDGTPEGTVMIKDIFAGAGDSRPGDLVNVGGSLFFRANDGVNGSELWRSDGTENGTLLVDDIYSGLTGSSPTRLIDINGTLFFLADDGIHGRELWAAKGPQIGKLIQAEHFDFGGEGTAYHDAEPENVLDGGFFRPGDGVDLEATTDTGGGLNIGSAHAGEWVAYTVDVPTSGNYTLRARVASIYSEGKFHIEFGGIDVTGPITVPNTGGWQTWQTIAVPDVPLNAGIQEMRVVFDQNGVRRWGKQMNYVGNFNWFRIDHSQQPFNGTPVDITATIEAEDFDIGGQGIVYHDRESANVLDGGFYRPGEGVDLEFTADIGGGLNIGSAHADEWVEYTVEVPAAGNYTLNARVASIYYEGQFHIEFDGVDVTGPIAVPHTGGWQIWQTVTVPDIPLTPGIQVMRVVFDKNGVRRWGKPADYVGNFNWFGFAPQ